CWPNPAQFVSVSCGNRILCFPQPFTSRKRLERERERLRGEIDNLKRQLEEAQRANKRQAAPFSRGTRKEHPKTPGRKPGAAYGRRYCKLPPKQVDEIVPLPLPRRCSCRGRVVFD